MNETFHELILQDGYFKNQYESLLKESVRMQFKQVALKYEIGDLDSGFLLSVASILAQSDKRDFQEPALRIVQFFLQDTRYDNSEIRAACTIILGSLTISRAVELAKKEELVAKDVESRFALHEMLDSVQNSVRMSARVGERHLFFNKFQIQAFRKTDQQTVSICAPTSSGKSFVLYQILLRGILQKDYKAIAYIVPTRALIRQVEDEFNEGLLEHGLKDIYVTSVPEIPEEVKNKRLVLIFTQERLQWFTRENPQVILDLLIIDEAHQIKEATRGILLQNMIETMTSRANGVQLVFASPPIENPEVMLEGIQTKFHKDIVKSEFVSVAQNVIWCKKVDGKRNWFELQLLYKDKLFPICQFEVEKSEKSKSGANYAKLSFFARKLGNPKGGNLIYANDPDTCEDIAEAIYDSLTLEESVKNEGGQEIIDLIAEVKGTLHEEYILVRLLQKRIAIHYGHLPQNIREGIEDCFRKGAIRYLICTSTLLQGVNLPASHLFVLKPRQGHKAMEAPDFWNLAGRVGRLGQEFQGNIICIEPEEWAPKIRTVPRITRSIKKITEGGAELVSFIKTGTPRELAQKNSGLEYATSYLYCYYLEHGEFSATQFDVQDQGEIIQQIKDEFDELKERVELPQQLIKNNIGISPMAIQNLLDWMKTVNRPVRLLPPDPDGSAAIDEFVKFYRILNKYLIGKAPNEKWEPKLCKMIVKWMSGLTLRELISRQIYGNEKHGKEYDLSKLIRKDILEIIEEKIRFEFLKYASCYVDVLTFYYTSILQDQDLIARIPKDFNMRIEFGLASTTQINLMKLGFLRNSCIKIAELLGKKNIDILTLIQFLRNPDIARARTLSAATQAEIKNVLRSKGYLLSE